MLKLRIDEKYITIACLAFAGLSFAQPLEQEEKEFVRYERKATELVQQPTYEAALVTAFKAGNAEKLHRTLLKMLICQF